MKSVKLLQVLILMACYQIVIAQPGKYSKDLNLAAQNIEAKVIQWREDIHEIMPVFDLLVLPSLNEGMGRVIVEAMASGHPVIGASV